MRVIVNAAMSADGKIALRDRRPLALSGREDFARVHRLRERADAILVGVGTVLADDPSLVVKREHVGHEPTRHPIRVILDSRGRAPPKARVFDGRAKTLVLTGEEGRARTWPNAETVVAGDERVDLRRALLALQARGVGTLMVEGGATVIGSFLRARLVDDLFTFIAPTVIGGGAPSLVEGPGAVHPEHALPMRLMSVGRVDGGVLVHWQPEPAPGE